MRYVRGVLSGGYYYSIAPQWVASLTGEGGYVHGINDIVRIEDRFFVGGDNLRGFKIGGVGPRDTQNDSLGANTYYVGTLSLGFPLGLPQELGITGRVFSDFGTAYGVDETATANDQIADTHFIRVSAGFGISWASPLGPIRLDLAVPVRRESFDKTQFFRVNLGTRF